MSGGGLPGDAARAGAVLELRGLSLHDGERFYVEKASLRLEAGEVLAVTGDPGAGKSLLLRALAGLTPAGLRREGHARVSGRAALAVANPALAPELPLEHQFAELLSATAGLDPEAARVRAAAALDRMGAPSPAKLLDLPPRALTDALRWRAALALAMAGGPALLLADAPGAALDPTVRAELLARLAGWAREAGVALLLAGRPEDGVDGPADRVLALERGRLGPPAPAPAVAHAAQHPSGPPVLSARDLSVAFPLGDGRVLTAVEGVSFGVARGETLALLGETGSGKAVLARALARLAPVSGGRVTWMAQDLARAGDEMRRDIQLLFPHPAAALDPLMTVGAQLTQLLKRLRPDIPAGRRPAQIGRALERAGLPAATGGRYPGALTPEEAARAGLARALVTEPRLLIGDEPAGTLSGAAREAFLARLLRLQEEEGVSLVLATQDAGTGLRVAHRALVLAGGRVVEAADAAVLADGARHPYSRALVAAARGERPGLLPGEAQGRQEAGCPVRARCPSARGACAEAMPPLEEVAPGHWVACHGPEPGQI
ncbi:oligopeptide/dipeptide ABC transporter ATP-binding protein [Azospirillum sp. SYSU D00513]|uniref:ABC transporter ATP-binding protein n=1 Tax=Azospirillum sp. SYSU D00513 TaxID=2812561 RepID=UPI0032B32FB3